MESVLLRKSECGGAGQPLNTRKRCHCVRSVNMLLAWLCSTYVLTESLNDYEKCEVVMISSLFSSIKKIRNFWRSLTECRAVFAFLLAYIFLSFSFTVSFPFSSAASTAHCEGHDHCQPCLLRPGVTLFTVTAVKVLCDVDRSLCPSMSGK